MTYFWVALGGSVGAMCRYALQNVSVQYADYTIIAVNAIGCFILGFISQKDWNPLMLTAISSGFCGSLTTFSTWIAIQAALAQAAEWKKLIAYAGFSILSGAIALYAGQYFGKL